MNLNFMRTENPWRPAYPKTENQKVEFSEEELQTMVFNERVGLSVSDTPLDSPACFCTASGDLYARLNWGHWCLVSKSNPNHVASIRAAHYCRITLSLNNEIKDFIAPVFHVAELPKELFGSYADPYSARRKNAAIDELKCSMPDGVDAMAFTSVVLDGEELDLVVSGDNDTIVFAVFPENDDLSALPPGAKQAEAEASASGIAPDLLDTLVNQRKGVEMEGGSGVKVTVAIIASSNTIASMKDAWHDELVKRDIDLVEFSDFANYVKEHMPLLEEDDDDDTEDVPPSSSMPDDDDDTDDIPSSPMAPDGSPCIERSQERMKAEVGEIQVAVDAEVDNCAGSVLARFRPETLTLDNGFPFDILLVGGHCLAAVYSHVPGEWLAEESQFADNRPLWFSELDNMVSPVYYGQACRDFFNGKIPGLKIGVIVIFTRRSSVINEEEMLDCWREGCHVSVVRTRRRFDSKLTPLGQYLSSLPKAEVELPQIDPSIILDLASEFASTFSKGD